MIILRPDVFLYGPDAAPDCGVSRYLEWAEDIRRRIQGHITANGIATPAVNPLNWGDTGSPNFLVLMYTCILASGRNLLDWTRIIIARIDD
jgi:hypothetical protein